MHTTRAIAHQLGAVRHLQGYPLLGYMRLVITGNVAGLIYNSIVTGRQCFPGATSPSYIPPSLFLLYVCTWPGPLCAPTSIHVRDRRGLEDRYDWPRRQRNQSNSTLVVPGQSLPMSSTDEIVRIVPQLLIELAARRETVVDRRSGDRESDQRGQGRGARSITMRSGPFFY